MPGNPFSLGITVYGTDGSTAQSNVSVTIRNESSNETQTNTTDSSGQVIFNLANFTSGWSVGDIISYFTLYLGYEASGSFTATDTGGATHTLTLAAKTVAPSLRYFTVQEFLNTFNLATYDSDNTNGIKPQTVVSIGQSVESYIDQILYRTFDSNSGSYYAATDEYLTAIQRQTVYFLKNTPVYSISKFQVNINLSSEEEEWKNLVHSQLDSCDAITDWSAGTDGAIALNTSNDKVKEGSGCINITKSGATQASVLYSKSLGSSYDFMGRIFKVEFYNADNTELASSGTAVEIRIGSDASNYYSMAFTKSDISQGGWNTLALAHDSDDSDASTTGTPSVTACDYVAVNITYASSATTVTAGDMRLDNIRLNDKEDLNINYNTGRIEISPSADYAPEPGKDQIKATYRYGSTVPYDIKRLAILLTGRSFASQALQRLNIDVTEASGLGAAIQAMNSYQDEINAIIENRKFPLIENIFPEKQEL